MTPATEPRTPSIRSRLLRWLLPPLLIVVALGIALDYGIAANLLRRTYDEALGNATHALAARLRSGQDGSPTLQWSDEAAAALRPGAGDRRYFLVIDADGGYIAGDSGMALTSSSHDPAMVFLDAERHGRPLREAIHRARVGDRDVIVAVAETTHARDAALRHLLFATLGGNLAQLALTLAIVWFGVRIGLSSLLRIRDTLAARAEPDLVQIPAASAPDEARPLVQAMNQAIKRARAAGEARQQFVADAAHQLRKPLVAVRTGLELLEGELRDSPQRERARILLADSRRLSHTTHQLLAMAQADAVVPSSMPLQPLDLRTLVADSAERALDRALGRGIDLGIEAQSIVIDGVPWLLNEALANLIDNALLYSPRGARVTVRCGPIGTGALLEVEDDGPGIPPDQRDRVRERFHRGRETGVDGTGLGLAIVEQAARVHAAQFTIDAGADGRGSRCRLLFALASGSSNPETN